MKTLKMVHIKKKKKLKTKEKKLFLPWPTLQPPPPDSFQKFHLTFAMVCLRDFIDILKRILTNWGPSPKNKGWGRKITFEINCLWLISLWFKMQSFPSFPKGEKTEYGRSGANIIGKAKSCPAGAQTLLCLCTQKPSSMRQKITQPFPYCVNAVFQVVMFPSEARRILYSERGN